MKAHYWSRCQMCGPIVICGKCGMNQCSGGTGELADGSRCGACESAHAKYIARDGLPWWGRVLDWWGWVELYAWLAWNNRTLRPWRLR